MPGRKKAEHPWPHPRWGWNPLLGLESLKLTMNDLLSNLFAREAEVTTPLPWPPQVNLFTLKNELVLEVFLPGAEKEDIDIHTTSSVLVIKGVIAETPAESFFIRERKAGEFFRVIPLPYKVKTNGILATLEKGVLTIRLKLRKKPEEKSYKVEIQ